MLKNNQDIFVVVKNRRCGGIDSPHSIICVINYEQSLMLGWYTDTQFMYKSAKAPHWRQTWKKPFFCELWNFGNTDLAEKKRKWRKIWNRDKTAKIKYLTQMHFFPFWQVIRILPCYIHSIYIFYIIYRLWRWHFLSYFLFARSRIQNWRKNGPIWQKIQKKI